MLDEKIDILNKIHVKLKQKRLSLNKHPTSNNIQDGIKQSDLEGSRRTLPVVSHYKHSYVRKETLVHKEPAVQCHNSESLAPCRLCESFLVNCSQNQVSLNPVQLDHSYHSSLSLPTGNGYQYFLS